MDALLTAIVLWLSVNFGLPSTFAHPHIERVPWIEMTISQKAKALPERTNNVLATYNNRTKTIFLSHQWTGRTPAELSILVHEMVHHLQHEAGIAYECQAAREKLAYEAQEKWLSLFGHNLEGDLGINPLAVLVRSSCAMASGL